jgi:hypothetical protein
MLCRGPERQHSARPGASTIQAASPPPAAAPGEPPEHGRRLNVMTSKGNASLLAAITATLLAVTSACSNGGGHGYGSVTGIAAPCVGVALPGTSAVTIYAKRHGVVVKSDHVVLTRSPGNRYDLKVPPGSYAVSAPQSDLPVRTISVRAQETVVANFIPACK